MVVLAKHDHKQVFKVSKPISCIYTQDKMNIPPSPTRRPGWQDTTCMEKVYREKF